MRVYIAGPISKGDLAANIRQASVAFHELARAGHSPMCPHWSCFGDPNPALFLHVNDIYAKASIDGGGLPHSEWLRIDIDWLTAAAEAVIRLPGESTGADAEVAAARAKSIPVYDSVTAFLTAHPGGPT